MGKSDLVNRLLGTFYVCYRLTIINDVEHFKDLKLNGLDRLIWFGYFDYLAIKSVFFSPLSVSQFEGYIY